MASALGVAATNYSSDDVNELMKQIEAQSKSVSQAPIQAGQNGRSIPRTDVCNSTPNTRLTRMVKQVRDVLPQVPSAVIARDLSELQLLFAGGGDLSRLLLDIYHWPLRNHACSIVVSFVTDGRPFGQM